MEGMIRPPVLYTISTAEGSSTCCAVLVTYRSLCQIRPGMDAYCVYQYRSSRNINGGVKMNGWAQPGPNSSKNITIPQCSNGLSLLPERQDKKVPL